MEKEERKNKKILTENRLSTVNKRETSYEGLAAQFENGEDNIYNLITEDKNILFQPKNTITQQDLEKVPPLKELREGIATWEKILQNAKGRDVFVAKKALIDLRKDQYLIKTMYLKPVEIASFNHSTHDIELPDSVSMGENSPEATGISLINPKVVSLILCNYSALKQNNYDRLNADAWYLMQDFDRISNIALEPYPALYKLMIYKIDGKQNAEIQQLLEEEFGVRHSLEYISSLWRKKIPALIASVAEDEYLNYYYLNDALGKYKKCSKCGQIKLALPKYYSKNKTSKDGFYSICKRCRSIKKEGKY